ncbi:(4Fe-4S)-binding protein [Reichenbachiella versicolor]|uniref:(4Fe-4S)-binding protein n=1 Tax=Reichenbachiella versicolor TaxID=1821036 RepID=UPI000D6E7CA1|nr:(4Fe-4S)-binding protein [Reichenbachiella versicolor]
MPIRHYTKDGLTIKWDSSICVHSGVCVAGLSKVFKPKETPWIDMDAASLDEIEAQVKKCPSGAISIVGSRDQ